MPVLRLVGSDVVGAPVVDGVDEAVVGQVVPGGVHPSLTPRALVQEVDVLQSLPSALPVLLPVPLVAQAPGRQAALRHPPAGVGAGKMNSINK